MKHKKIRKKLLRYIDAELPQGERIEIKRHLERCEQCRKDLQLLSDAWKLSQPIRRVLPSPFLWNGISEQLAGKTQKRVLHKLELFIRRTAHPALTAAVVILGLIIGIKLGNRLMTAELSGQPPVDNSLRLKREFGLENFRIFSSGSLGGELAAFMEYENE